MKKTLLVTGAAGLIGSEIVEFLAPEYELVLGLDNNMRANFFGPQGDTLPRLKKLKSAIANFRHVDMDIRDRDGCLKLFQENRFSAVVHCAAQPSHDLAARIPFADFDTNAGGTLNLLEAARQSCPETVFVYMSTNKVYGDNPNRLALVEQETRYEYATEDMRRGIAEDMSVDNCLHSLFGVSKTAADLLVQEYGRNFGLRTICLRGGCLTGPNHAGVELHGFLNYLVRANVNKIPYTIFGYKGKQVRDNIHSHDVAACIAAIIKKPRIAEVYNLGGGRDNSCSVLEAISRIEELSGIKMQFQLSENARVGDHICYYSNLEKLQNHYPEWKITKSLEDIFREIIAAARP
jgi:CDP-paratose 2-epimerase